MAAWDVMYGRRFINEKDARFLRLLSPRDGLVVRYLLLEQQVELGDGVLAQDDGQELVEADVLDHADDDVARLLEQLLVVPVRVDLRQLGGDQVVLTHPQRVLTGQDELLVDSDLAAVEAQLVGVAAGAAFVRDVGFGRQQILEAVRAQHRVDAHLTAVAGAQ